MRLAVIETPPASPEAVARLMAAARMGGRSVALDLAEKARAMAADCAAMASLKDAVSPGILEQSARMAEALTAFAASVEKLAQ